MKVKNKQKISDTHLVRVDFIGIHDNEPYIIKSFDVDLIENDPVTSFGKAWHKFCMWSAGKFRVSEITLNIVAKEENQNKQSED